MGTNFYLHRNICSCCGRGDEPLHIGKSSGGWVFALHIYPENGINDLEDWIKIWTQQNATIKDEYERIVIPDVMMDIITERKWPRKKDFDPDWLRENYAEPGPNGLARSVIDGRCVKHGNGTWDCFVGEFS